MTRLFNVDVKTMKKCADESLKEGEPQYQVNRLKLES